MKLLIILAAFVIVILFLVVLAIFLERYWRNYQLAQAAKGLASKAIGANLAESVAKWSAQLRGLVQPKQQAEGYVKQFREWVTRDLSQEKELQSWLLLLPDAGLVLLTEHIAAFCQEMNFDLQWLIEQKVAVAPELKAAMQDVVVDYCRACQRAIPAQNQAKLFTAYQQLLDNATSKEAQALSRTLYTNLITQGLLPMPTPTDLLNATDKERCQQAIQVIQQAAAKDWTQFAQVLQATITPPGAAAPPLTGQNGHGKPPKTAEEQKAGRPTAEKAS